MHSPPKHHFGKHDHRVCIQYFVKSILCLKLTRQIPFLVDCIHENFMEDRNLPPVMEQISSELGSSLGADWIQLVKILDKIL